jgi:hypothetical protein
MKIDINQYRACIPNLTYVLNKFPEKDVCVLAGEFSAGTHVPLIAVCHYIIEIKGENLEVRKMINSLLIFYKYSKLDK